MPSFKCTRCDTIYTEGNKPTRKPSPGYCQTCKDVAAVLEDRVDDLEGYTRASRDNIHFHGLQIQSLTEQTIPQIQQDLASVREECHDTAVKLREIEAKTQIEAKRMDTELERQKLMNDHELNLAKIKADQDIALNKDNCMAKIEIARHEAEAKIAEAKVAEKRELNKALDKIGNSKTVSASLLALFANGFSLNATPTGTRSTNSSIAGDTEDDSSFPSSIENHPPHVHPHAQHQCDSPVAVESDKWTKVHKRIKSKTAPNTYQI